MTLDDALRKLILEDSKLLQETLKSNLGIKTETLNDEIIKFVNNFYINFKNNTRQKNILNAISSNKNKYMAIKEEYKGNIDDYKEHLNSKISFVYINLAKNYVSKDMTLLELLEVKPKLENLKYLIYTFKEIKFKEALNIFQLNKKAS